MAGGGVSQGTLGFVQHETAEDCHVQLLLCRTGLPETPGSASGIGQDCMNRPYGPVCPVVWEGEGREAFPYPDFILLSAPADQQTNWELPIASRF